MSNWTGLKNLNAPAIALEPLFVPVKQCVQETYDVVTLEFDLPETAYQLEHGASVSKNSHSTLVQSGTLSGRFLPGQFNMMYVYGVGEIAISISGDPFHTEQLSHTIRGVGPVSRALLRLSADEPVGLRGPYGRGWPMSEIRGKDVLLIAGGMGLPPLRPVLYHLLGNREHFGNVALLYGARTPDDMVFSRELQQWSDVPDLQVEVTVDNANVDWSGNVGVVTQLIDQLQFVPEQTIAMICGPDIMIRFASLSLQDAGVPANQIYVSMERNMKCAIGTCGHCQFGPHFICKDGPVFALSDIHGLFNSQEI